VLSTVSRPSVTRAISPNSPASETVMVVLLAVGRRRRGPVSVRCACATFYRSAHLDETRTRRDRSVSASVAAEFPGRQGT
jgi:hypothetical protein